MAVSHAAEVIHNTMKIVPGTKTCTLEILLISAIRAEFQVLQWEIYIGLQFSDSHPALTESFKLNYEHWRRSENLKFFVVGGVHQALRTLHLILKDFSPVKFLQAVIEICVVGFGLVKIQVDRSVLNHLVGMHVIVVF